MSVEESGSELDMEEQDEEQQIDYEEDEEESSSEEEDEDSTGGFSAGIYGPTEVNDTVFEELHMGPDCAEEVRELWSCFLLGAESREVAGEAIYAALFDAAPSLQSLFKTPRAVMAMRFMNGLNQIICSVTDPKALKVIVETLGFQHLDLEVTVPRVVIFRDAIVDLLSVEMGDRFTKRARDGFSTLLNYVGGAYIYVRVKFSERLKIIATSWATANNKQVGGNDEAGENKDLEDGNSGEREDDAHAAAANSPKSQKSRGWSSFRGSKPKAAQESALLSGKETVSDFRNTAVPKTFPGMFMFNAAVMGFSGQGWMNEILASWDTVVSNVSNSYRLQEECDVLSLRLSKYRGNINLSQYKAVMLASLRSLCKDWGTAHEVAWSWLWENVERMLKALMGKPAVQEAALVKMMSSLDSSAQDTIRREVYSKFFALAPAGQDFFKQSTTRLHFIADKLVAMTLDMYKEPKRMVEDISALGLRHVGYGIPTDLFGPFVTACVQVVRALADDELAEEAFRWSLGLISRILVRVINEGSTIVMKAINANSGKQLRKAVGCAPRGKRALWMLNVQVGTQSISPFMWAIETGSLDAAKAMIIDLLTIRADRDRYYYGMDILFERHSDMIRRLSLDAPALLPTLLNGLVWRSRTTENGQRRVNYYVKHLLVDAEGEFSKAIEWLAESRDPKIVCNPVIALVTDLVWGRVAYRTFLLGKVWFLFTLIVFITSQSVLNRLQKSESWDDEIASSSSLSSSSSGDLPLEIRVAIFMCRCFIYIFSLGQHTFSHARWIIHDLRNKDLVHVGCISIPAYLLNWQDCASLVLIITLACMLCIEPILHCLSHSAENLFTEHCEEGENLLFVYSIFSTLAMLIYFILLTDLAVFSTRVSAFVLVAGRVLVEVGLFLFGLIFVALAFACAISALEQDDPDFAGIPKSGVQLIKMTLGMFGGVHYDILSEYPALMVAAVCYIITTVVFMLNLLIAQLTCSYQATYLDMVGFARLNRGKIITETMPSVSKRRWEAFICSLRLDERLEFGVGDIGLSGGLQVLEPASAHITTVDMIRRFGGSTSPAAQWPQEEGTGLDEDEDRFDRLEKIVEKAMKRMSSTARRKHGQAGGSSSGLSSAMEKSSDSAGSIGISGSE